jgi:hypothetical protein
MITLLISASVEERYAGGAQAEQRYDLHPDDRSESLPSRPILETRHLQPAGGDPPSRKMWCLSHEILVFRAHVGKFRSDVGSER